MSIGQIERCRVDRRRKTKRSGNLAEFFAASPLRSSGFERVLQAREGEHSDELRSVLAHNLRLLSKQGVRIAVGSDSYRQTSLSEILNLEKLKIFDNRTDGVRDDASSNLSKPKDRPLTRWLRG